MSSFDEVPPSEDIVITTVTAHTALPTKINLFSISHFLQHHKSEWKEIATVKYNFGKQISSATGKRIFYFATWIGILSDVDRPHKLCIRFSGNGAVHVVGVINPSVEYIWLEDWLKRFLNAVTAAPVPCKANIKQSSVLHNLWVCPEGYIWSPTMKVPIGWAALPEGDENVQQLVLSGKPVRAVTSEGPVKFRTIKGDPMFFDALGHQLEMHSPPREPKRRRQTISDESLEKTEFKDISTSLSEADWSTSVQSVTGDEKLDTNNLDFFWTTDCINAKCSSGRILIAGTTDKYENWLDRDKFKEFIRKNYATLMVSFDPEIHKAVQITFFPDERNENGRLDQKGSVSVTRTGLFWLYGFQQMQFANDTSDMMQSVISAFRQTCQIAS